MRLLEMTVTNFRALAGAETTVSFQGSDIIFLVGQNNSGKSSVLAAYEYLVTPKKKAALSDFTGFAAAAPIRIVATFEKEAGDDAVFAKKGFDKWVAPDGRISFRKTWTAADEEGQKETLDPATGKFENNGFGGIETHFTAEAPTAVRIPAMPTTDDLSKFVSDLLKKTVLKTLKADEAIAYEEAMLRIRALQARVYSHASIADINTKANASFQKVFPELALAVRPEQGNEPDLSKLLEKEFSVTVQDPRLSSIDQPFLSLGHGVVRQAMFNFLGIVKNELPAVAPGAPADKKQYLILFEEPEIYLHPDAIFRLRRLLYGLAYDSPFQFLCTSHSPCLIDLSKPQTSIARVVRAPNGETAIRQAGHDVFARNEDQKQRVQMVNRFNPHVCEAFFADDVILVEGDTEAIVVRELLHRLVPTRSIYVLNTGSKTNMCFFQEVLTHFRIRQNVIHDADCRFQYSGGSRALKKNGEPKANPAWEQNAQIWAWVSRARSLDPALSQRFVCVRNFENQHGYSPDEEKGKPLSAYLFAQSVDNTAAIMRFVRQIVGLDGRDCDFTPDDLERLVVEPDAVPPAATTPVPTS